jgi:hypothetical protein
LVEPTPNVAVNFPLIPPPSFDELEEYLEEDEFDIEDALDQAGLDNDELREGSS